MNRSLTDYEKKCLHREPKLRRNKWVVHCKKEKFDIYIGRGTLWGNPFMIGVHGNRMEVIEKFRRYIMKDKLLLKRCKEELKGKVLGCHCAPRACHGEVLAEIANE